MLSDTDAKKRATDVEEGKIGEESDATDAAESEESLTGVEADLQDLVKQKTCYMARSLMTQAELDALRLEGCFEPGVCRVLGRKPHLNPERMKVLCFRTFSQRGFGFQRPRALLRY
jgi:hypothetical protein